MITKTYSIQLSKGALLQDGVLILSEQEFNELRDAVNSAAIPAQGKPLSPPSYPRQIHIPCANGGSYAVLTTTDPNAELTIPASCGIKDLYADLRKAQSEGKTLQLALTAGGWGDWEGEPSDDFPPYRYRVKPEEPAEPKAEESEWIEYKNEVPSNEACPLDPKTLVIVKCRDGTEHGPLLAEKFAWSALDRHDDITAYRIVKESREPDWIPWSGGECPVDPDDYVQVKYAGSISSGGKAEEWDWKHYTGNKGNITAYRIIKP